MRYWGRFIGAACGFLIAGPLGMLIGFFIGAAFDMGYLEHAKAHLNQNQAQLQAFIEATFSIMGHIAKSDGRISPEEIKMAKQWMERMHLSAEQSKMAQDYFNAGKQIDFDVQAEITRFRQRCARLPVFFEMFIDIQHQTALIDGMTPAKERLLASLVQELGFAPFSYQNYAGQQQQHWQTPPPFQNNSYQEEAAYRLLGIKPGSSLHDIKKAYRKLMSQHHPDKLMSKGLSQDMIKIATERTQEIQKAYDLLCKKF